MRISDTMQVSLRKKRQKERYIWQMFREHSEEYIRVLNLTVDDLKKLAFGILFPEPIHHSIFRTGLNGFLTLNVRNEKFAIAIKHVYGRPYGGEWEYRVFAVCMTSFCINQPLGIDSSLINVVPEDWHSRIFCLLKDKREECKEEQITLPN